MKKNNKILVIFTALFLATIGIIDKFFDSGIFKITANVLLILAYFYQIAEQLIPNSRTLKAFKGSIRRYQLGRLIIGDAHSVVLTDGPTFWRFKSQLLNFTNHEVDKRSNFVSTSDILTFDFGVFDDFKPGADLINFSEDWKSHLHEQFIFIIGKSGSGKTFELLKRAQYACNKIASGLHSHEQLKDVKIPIYIELKSLDRKLDQDWILDYLLKTAKISGYDLNEFQLKYLLQQDQVIYFLDGIDEIKVQFRVNAVKSIIADLTGTGVHVNCRSGIYGKLKEDSHITEDKRPGEYYLLPIDIEWIKEIVKSLKDRPAKEIAEMLELIDNRPGLVTYLSRPIFLNLFMIVYHRLSEEEKLKITQETESVAIDLLWENYEDIIFKKKLSKDSDLLGIRTITVWLAKIMHQQSFFVESIQPLWLSKIDDSQNVIQDKPLQRLYYLFTRIISSVIIGIALGCIVSTPFSLISDSVIGGITVSAIAGIYTNNHRRFARHASITNLIFTCIMLAVLISVCAIFQGFVLPRAPGDMINPYFSIVECWPGVIMGLALSTIFSYRIILEKAKQQYILPVELFHFDWSHAIRYGVSFGVASGLLTGSIALYVKNHFKNHLFIKSWLIPYLEEVILKFGGLKLTEQNKDYAVFIYAFLLTFFVASIIIILLAGRYNDLPEKDLKNKQNLNFGIKTSAKWAVVHAVCVAMIASLLYYIIMMRVGMGSIYFCLKISFGISLLAFLWFGGMEVINHWLLRVNLYFRGIAPLNYTTWVSAQHRMGLVIPSGYQMKFYHASLASYYMRYKIRNNPRIRFKTNISGDKRAYSFALLILFMIMLTPFIRRYLTTSLWYSPSEINITYRNVKEITKGIYSIESAGFYSLSASGYINIGTFVGYVQPKGTLHGFMGMPINDAYDIDSLKQFRHGALLFRTKKIGLSVWSSYKTLVGTDYQYFHKGSLIQFITNDKEWQNNIGKYRVDIAPCRNCK